MGDRAREASDGEPADFKIVGCSDGGWRVRVCWDGVVSRAYAAALSLGLAVFGGCFPAPVVSVATVGRRDLLATVSAAGCSVRAARGARVTAAIGGRVVRVATSEGARVAAGDVLIEIAAGGAEAEERRRAAAVDAACVDIERARLDVQAAHARLQLVTAGAARQERLWKARHVAREAYRKAVGEVAVWRTTVAEREAVETEATHRLRAAIADLEWSRRAAREARVLAPFGGTVTRLFVERGQQVLAGEPRHRGTVLLTLADSARLEVDVLVDASDVAALAAGQPVAVTVDAWPERVYEGRVEVVGYTPAGRGLYRTVVATVGGWGGVRPGFTCEAVITTATESEVVAVPKQSLLNRDGAAGVWVVRGGRLFFAPVALGVEGASHVEVLSGLRAGESVVTGPFDVASASSPGVAVHEERR